MPTNNDKLPINDSCCPPVADSSRLLVGCRREDYSASRIARAVEDTDAHLLNLNVTSFGQMTDGTADDGDEAMAQSRFPVVFDIRVTHRNPAAVSRSLERYGFTVLDVSSGDSGDCGDETTKERIDQLFRYLEI